MSDARFVCLFCPTPASSASDLVTRFAENTVDEDVTVFAWIAHERCGFHGPRAQVRGRKENLRALQDEATSLARSAYLEVARWRAVLPIARRLGVPELRDDSFLQTAQGIVRGAMAQAEGVPAPLVVPLILHCPLCHARHIDTGVFADEPHHTHACQSCGHCWRPALVATCGVQFLPGFKDEA